MLAKAHAGVSAEWSTRRWLSTLSALRASISSMNIDHPLPFERTSIQLLVIVPSATLITVTLHCGSVSQRSITLNTSYLPPLFYMVSCKGQGKGKNAGADAVSVSSNGQTGVGGRGLNRGQFVHNR